MRIGISADSTCDLSKEYVAQHNIHITPISVVLGEEIKRDGVDVTVDQLYDYVATTGQLPKTSALNPEEYGQHFSKVLEENDFCIHFALSFEISSTGTNARLMASQMDNVYVIDTKSLSSGSALLIMSCVDKIAEGKDVETIIKELESEVEKIQASFLVNTLKYLHKGGRCSGIALLGANLLKIKPRISLVSGKMEMTKKYRGNIESALIKYVEDILEEVKPNKKRVFVTSSSDMDCIPQIKQMLTDYGFEEVIEARAGCTISTHCGKNTLGVLYIAE
ncbi:MAG: DegV family protein [Clostridia bacterium]|nr:DegV family protein [Clostridia bacterium]